MTNSYTLIYEQVKRIPVGKVATYGMIAMLAWESKTRAEVSVALPPSSPLDGGRRWARVVGYALHVNPSQGEIPCHRVVNRHGKTSEAFAFGGQDIQRKLLEKEGVIFLYDGRVDLERCLWDGRGI